MPRSLLIDAAVIGLLLSNVLLAEEQRRKYEQGPLTAADFAGKSPENPPASARTATELRYEFRYTYKMNSRGTTVSLSSIEIDAYIRQDLSWNLKPDDARLLDHEQGHADICRIECFQARLAMRDKMRKGFSASAGSLRDATAALKREVTQVMAGFEQAIRDADAEYDRGTMHGIGPQQEEWRRVQQETLKDLEAKWRGKPPSASR